VFITAGILGRVFAPGPVTRHRVEGAVAVYLLVGMIFGVAYALIALTVPDAFNITGLPANGWSRESFDAVMGAFGYFSFVTMTTVGYGDVTPVSQLAKQLAVVEGLIGQLYPAILLARLVSLQVSARND
jgi:voltage-gated potassium channel Kch